VTSTTAKSSHSQQPACRACRACCFVIRSHLLVLYASHFEVTVPVDLWSQQKSFVLQWKPTSSKLPCLSFFPHLSRGLTCRPSAVLCSQRFLARTLKNCAPTKAGRKEGRKEGINFRRNGLWNELWNERTNEGTNELWNEWTLERTNFGTNELWKERTLERKNELWNELWNERTNERLLSVAHNQRPSVVVLSFP